MKKMIAVGFGLVLGALTYAAAGVQQSSEQPRPGKEHELLKQFEGEWEFMGSVTMAPGESPKQIKGTETAKMSLDGFWLTIESKGETPDKKLEGRGAMGYDTAKGRYVATWINNCMPQLFVATGYADGSGKVFTLMGEGVDPKTRKPVQEKLRFEIKDADTWVFTSMGPGSNGAEQKTCEVTYTRKK